MNTWMRSSGEETVVEDKEIGDVHSVVPKKFNADMKVMFGFEIGHPAYPAYDDSWKKLILTTSEMNSIISSLKDVSDGAIVWETFKPTETASGV